jgi:hypothetical protein
VRDIVADFHDDDASALLGPDEEEFGPALHNDTDSDDVAEEDVTCPE